MKGDTRGLNKLKSLRFVHLVIIFTLAGTLLLYGIYVATTPPRIKKFENLEDYNGLTISVKGIVLSKHYDSKNNEMDMTLYGTEGGTMDINIEYVNSKEKIEEIDINTIVSIQGELSIYGSSYRLNCANDNSLTVHEDHEPRILSIANATSPVNLGRYVCMEGEIIRASLGLNGKYSSIELKDPTGSVYVYFHEQAEPIPIGSTIKLYGVTDEYSGMSELVVFSSKAVEVTSPYDPDTLIPLASIAIYPLDYVDKGVTCEGYLTMAPTTGSNYTSFHLAPEPGEDFSLAKPRIRCVYGGKLDLEKGDRVKISNFTLRYEDDNAAYYFEPLENGKVEVLSRHGPWHPPMTTLCEKIWLFENSLINITSQIKEKSNTTSYIIGEENISIVVNLERPMEISIGAAVRASGRITYLPSEARYALSCQYIEIEE